MKFTKKSPMTDEALSTKLQAEGWEKIKEPKSIGSATLLALPLAFLLGAITLALTYWLTPSLYAFLKETENLSVSLKLDLFTVFFVGIMVLFMMGHEFIHAMFIPNWIKSDKTFWGMNGLFGFVFTTEMISKKRFIIISIMPYIILSVIFPCVLAISGGLNGYMVFLCLLNATGSCVDFLNILLIAFQVPKGASIMNNGFETYYKA